MKKIFTVIAISFTWAWKILSTGAKVATNLVFLLALLFFAGLFFFHPETKVPNGAALVLAPEGDIVEQRSAIDPMARVINKFAGVPVHEETPLQDILDAINTAADDDRIKLLVLSPAKLKNVGLNQLRDIGQAIEHFKDSGKIVIAGDDGFNQPQYYLAAYADEIYLNPMGSVDLHGFGVFRLYFKELLNKLNVKLHVFRVGTFKSATEPFLRDNMSPAAKEANRQWLTQLWTIYCRDIGKQRGLPVELINNVINNLDLFIQKAHGDGATMALNVGLVDGIKTHRQFDDYLSSLVGRDNSDSGFKKIALYDYLDTITRTYTEHSTDTPAVGIIVAQGNIVNDEGAVGQIGADTLIQQIRKARNNRNIKAIVLRIDSGGGSAFASERIRQELLYTREAGKPIIVSMGSMAASGAYWLSADANLILASPVTLTGSIGIFGLVPTFEQSLARAGVFSDGIGTTSLAGGISVTRALPPALSRSLQLGVEHGYRQFISIVAKGRKLTPSKVEEIAEGRVWDGKTAIAIGLVDGIGSLKDAVKQAAKLAGLQRPVGIYIDQPSTFFSSLQQFGSIAIQAVFHGSSSFAPLSIVTGQVRQQFDFILKQPDPGNIYAHSLLTSSTIAF